jgi:aryl-alcohol dehydrogenase-like predicted oxidoreductase
MIWRAPEAELFDLCRKHDISNVVWSPLAQGVLTGKYKPGERPPEGTRAATPGDSGFMERFMRDDLLEAVQNLRPIADELGITLAQMAVAWVLREPGVSSAIVGASRPEQVDENVSASGIELPPDALARIDEVLSPVR